MRASNRVFNNAALPKTVPKFGKWFWGTKNLRSRGIARHGGSCFRFDPFDGLDYAGFPFLGRVVAGSFQLYDAVGVNDPVLGDAEDLQDVSDIAVGRQDGEGELVLFEEGSDQTGIFVHVQGDELDAGAILVFLDHFLQARQLLAAEPSPGRPEVQECYLALQGLQIPRLASEVGEIEGGQWLVDVLPGERRRIGQSIGAAAVPNPPSLGGAT
jgi:hypothetical protein